MRGIRLAVILALCGWMVFSATPASAASSAADTTTQSSTQTDAQSAAQLATADGYRTGIAVLNLQTGQYTGAGEDTGSFASESVAKVLIATELLLSGQMAGSTETTAYQMITQSDDADADALYGLAGGDNVINLVAAHYDIPFLGTPPSQPGWWGNTEINAKGMVYLYAAIAKDPTVGPWLMNAMAHATEFGADGTYQFFGIPAATTGAAIKQGWGDDGDDSPNAVFNSTGYVDNGHFAVAILTDGSPSTYGATISAMVTAEAKALMPNGQLDDPAEHNPVLSAPVITSVGSTVQITGTAADPDAAGAPVPIQIKQGARVIATGSTGAGGVFDIKFLAVDGAHTFTVTADNLGEGTANTSIDAAAIVVNGDPRGHVLSVAGGTGQLTIRGQEMDPNLAPGEAATLTVAVNGQPAITERANANYDVVLPAPTGHDQVSIVYVHSDDGQNVAEGRWWVTVAQTRSQRRLHTIIDVVPPSSGGAALVLVGLVLLWRRRAANTIRV
jgi:hypothetical protein